MPGESVCSNARPIVQGKSAVMTAAVVAAAPVHLGTTADHRASAVRRPVCPLAAEVCVEEMAVAAAVANVVSAKCVMETRGNVSRASRIVRRGNAAMMAAAVAVARVRWGWLARQGLVSIPAYHNALM